ncbi:MAG: type pilus assembly protein PilZ [Gammaproteobacteria bacterium]|jgi:Tfp pilus assembly protein PilZ|nr:type pilus assembly protein PilZ [Gammaproteobacteria bacterium]
MSEKDQTPAQADIPILSLSLDDIEKVYRAYMPYVKKGGAIFVPTKHPFELNAPVFLSLHFLKEPAPYRFQGQVVWVMAHTSGDSLQGVGVQLGGKEGEAMNEKIRTLLRGMDNSKPTDTI